jgi:hypothetical protein
MSCFKVALWLGRSGRVESDEVGEERRSIGVGFHAVLIRGCEFSCNGASLRRPGCLEPVAEW